MNSLIICGVIGLFIGLFYLIKKIMKPWDDLDKSMFELTKISHILDMTLTIEELKEYIKKLDENYDTEYINHYENMIIGYENRIKNLEEL